MPLAFSSMTRLLARSLVRVGVVLALSPQVASAQSETAPAAVPTSGFSATFTHFAVAADHPVASAAGAEMLAKGGNAVDAAVAASFTLSVVRPFSCGIGGGGFMLISLPPKDSKPNAPRIERAINYRELAPRAARKNLYESLDQDRASLDGALAAGVPGTVAGLLYALETYGTLDRATVLAPAIRAAREGFQTDGAYMRAAINATERFVINKDYQTRFAFTWERFLGSGAIALGDTIKNPEQAALLEAIARDGAAAFYSGTFGKSLIEHVNADALITYTAGGRNPPRNAAWFTEQDFKLPRVDDGEPLTVEFLGKRVLLMPPPSSGGIAIGQILGLAERRGLATLWAEGNSASYAHQLAESFKFAFADRANYLADPKFTAIPVKKLLGAQRLDDFARRINPSHSYGPEYYGEPGQIKIDSGTSHISVIDGRGGAVACTETINTEFGSYLAVPGSGFCLNNQMDDFTTRLDRPNAYGLRQSEKNLPEPGKRPLSSMSPTIVLDADAPIIVAGASGGPRIITATAQSILNILVRNMNAADAVAAKRMHHQWLPSVLEIERGFDDREIMNGMGVSLWLRKVRQNVKDATSGAVVQLIHRTPAGTLDAVSDPRKGGAPAGE
ncbi:MAG: gamma-glutamyltransferase [Phycisphaeraceae bacterium]|nr:gamma-glutamyltransferase [Phycisphaeraceae bacterium]